MGNTPDNTNNSGSNQQVDIVDVESNGFIPDPDSGETDQEDASNRKGIARIFVRPTSSLKILRGSPFEPYLVEIGSEEEGNYIETFVPEQGYYPATTDSEKKNVKWLATMRGTDISVLDTGSRIQIKIPKKLCGSTTGWVEAYQYKPHYKPPQGFHYKGKCEAKITKVTWYYYYDENTEGAEIPESGWPELEFGANVKLEIETEGLNGDALDLTFFGNGHFLEKIHNRTVNGKLTIKMPIKLVWHSLVEGNKLGINVQINSRNLKLKDKIYGNTIRVKQDAPVQKFTKNAAVPVVIGTTPAPPPKYDPCMFTALTIVETEPHPVHGREEYVFFDEDAKPQMRNIKNYEIVSGSGARTFDRLFVVMCKNYATDKCLIGQDLKPSFGTILDRPLIERINHAEHEVQITWWDGNEGAPKHFETKKIIGNKFEYHVSSYIPHFVILPTLKNIPMEFLLFIWPAMQIRARYYEFTFDTCRNKITIPLAVYSDVLFGLRIKFQAPNDAFAPNIEDAVNISLKAKWDDRREGKLGMTNISPKVPQFKDSHHESAGASPVNIMNDLGFDTYYEGTDKDTWKDANAIEVGVDQEIGIKKSIALLFKMKQLLHGLVQEAKGNAPCTFELIGPNLQLCASWGLFEIDENYEEHRHQVSTVLQIVAESNPLIGIQFEWNILTTAAEFLTPAVAAVVGFLQKNKYTDIEFKVVIVGTISITVAKQVIYTVIPNAKKLTSKLEGGIKLEIILSVKAGSKYAMQTFKTKQKYHGDKSDENGVFVEATGRGETGVRAGLEIDLDESGLYWVPTFQFDGVLFEAIFMAHIKYGILSYDPDYSPPEIPWIEPSRILKEWTQPHYLFKSELYKQKEKSKESVNQTNTADAKNTENAKNKENQNKSHLADGTGDYRAPLN